MIDTLAADGVVLRPWRPSDVAAIASICGDPEVSAWDRIPWERDDKALLSWIDLQRSRHGDGRIALAITRGADDVALGWIGLWPSGSTPGAWEIGYWIVPEARRQGLTLAAARMGIAHVFGAGLADRILLATGPENAGSRAIAAALGARLIGTEAMKDRAGVEHEGVIYEITP